jgi:hypothetical protein
MAAVDVNLLSVEEFGRRLGGISPATIHSWLTLGKFGLERIKVGGRTMLDEAQLLRVLQQSKPVKIRRRRVQKAV